MSESGAYGEVRKCQHRITKAERAVKIILKSLIEEDERKKLMNEVEILRKMVSEVANDEGPPQYLTSVRVLPGQAVFLHRDRVRGSLIQTMHGR